MAGPIDEGSSMTWSIWTSPISVPTIPMAGAVAPMNRNSFCPCLCRSRRLCISPSRALLTSSTDRPSTARRTPFAMNGSSIS